MHSVEEMHEHLVVDMEFLDLGMVKIEAERPVAGLDNLLASLNEQHRSTWVVPASSEQYIRRYGWPTISDCFDGSDHDHWYGLHSDNYAFDDKADGAYAEPTPTEQQS